MWTIWKWVIIRGWYQRKQFHDPAVTSTIVYADCGGVKRKKQIVCNENFIENMQTWVCFFVLDTLSAFSECSISTLYCITHKNATHICENIYLQIYDMFVACLLPPKALQIFHFNENSFLPSPSTCASLAWHKTC